MAKHLLDETAEFKIPQLGRHAAEDGDGLETTQRFDPASGATPEAPQDPAAR